jgi:transposase
LHRHQWVRLRTRVQNALHAIVLGSGVQRGHPLWNRDGQAMLAALSLAPHAADRRDDLQALYRQFDSHIDHLDRRVKQVAAERPHSTQLMTHPGVGHVTALATEVFLGDPSRFADGKALASSVGMIPSEYSSGQRQRLGGLSKQGNPLLRFLWGEAAMHAVRRDLDLQRFYRRKLQQKGLGKARVAAARKLGIRLWIMLRDQIDYAEFCRRSPRRPS